MVIVRYTIFHIMDTPSSKYTPHGLTSQQAKQLLAQFGPNTIPEKKTSPLLSVLKKFWGPIPWMLEASLVIEIILKNRVQAIVIALLMIMNAVISVIQEHRSQKSLELLKAKLSITARALRDGKWQVIPAQELVPGDLIHLRMGDFTPADVHLVQGNITVDQSSLTGESLPVELKAETPRTPAARSSAGRRTAA